MMWIILGIVIGIAFFIAVWIATAPRRNPAEPKQMKGQQPPKPSRPISPPPRTSGSVKRATPSSGGYIRDGQVGYTAAAQTTMTDSPSDSSGDSGGGSCD